MSAEAWIAFTALAMTILASLGSCVWTLSSIKTTVDRIDETLHETVHAVEKHSEECDPDRQRLGWRLDAMELKLKELFS